MANQGAVVDTIEDYSKMKVVELKKILKDRGLAISGTKDELIERLKQANEAAEKKLLEETAEEVEDSGAAPTAIDEDLENEIMNEESKVTSTDLKADKRKLVQSKTSNASSAVQKGGTEDKENASGGDAQLDNGTSATDPAEPARKMIKLSSVTPEEKKELRTKKFGLTEEEKKEARAKRFGVTPSVKSNSIKPLFTTVKKSLLTKENSEVLKKRAEKFGLPSSDKLTPEEADKRKKRAERFGNNTPAAEAVKLTPEEVEKRKKRAERFGNNTPEAVAVKK